MPVAINVAIRRASTEQVVSDDAGILPRRPFAFALAEPKKRHKSRRLRVTGRIFHCGSLGAFPRWLMSHRPEDGSRMKGDKRDRRPFCGFPPMRLWAKLLIPALLVPSGLARGVRPGATCRHAGGPEPGDLPGDPDAVFSRSTTGAARVARQFPTEE
jgi:hypothetical protein